MQIKRQKVKRKLKRCKYIGCDQEFLGHPISKYCDYHSDIKNREKKITKKRDVLKENKVIEHDSTKIINIELSCSLTGCRIKYEIEILPKVFIYPKFCTEHRNKYKREYFLEVREKKKNELLKGNKFVLKPLITSLKIPENVAFRELGKWVVIEKSSNNKFRMAITGCKVFLSERDFENFLSEKNSIGFIKIPEEERISRKYGNSRSFKDVTALEEFEEILFDYFK